MLYTVVFYLTGERNDTIGCIHLDIGYAGSENVGSELRLYLGCDLRIAELALRRLFGIATLSKHSSRSHHSYS